MQENSSTRSSASDTVGSGADALKDAASKGRQTAELFDLRLRQTESREREARRTARDTARRGPRIEELSFDALARETLIRNLRNQVEELAAFQRAVLVSRSWRLIQFTRRLLGRT